MSLLSSALYQVICLRAVNRAMFLLYQALIKEVKSDQLICNNNA